MHVPDSSPRAHKDPVDPMKVGLRKHCRLRQPTRLARDASCFLHARSLAFHLYFGYDLKPQRLPYLLRALQNGCTDGRTNTRVCDE